LLFLLHWGHFVDLDNLFFLERVDLVVGSDWELSRHALNRVEILMIEHGII